MEKPDGQVLGGFKLLGKSCRMYASHVRMYLSLMILMVLFQVLMAAVGVYGIGRAGTDKNLREIWITMGEAQRLGFAVGFLLSLAVFYRVLAGSILATSEFSAGRTIGALEAFRRARWKHTRLFWLIMAGSLLTGPAGPLTGLVAGFFFAHAFPAAVLEDLGAFKALERGGKLGAGNQLRILTIYVMYLAVVAGVCIALFEMLVFVQDHFGKAWYARPAGSIAFLIFFTVIQWYMIVLTLNYLQQSEKLNQFLPVAAMPAQSPQG